MQMQNFNANYTFGEISVSVNYNIGGGFNTYASVSAGSRSTNESLQYDNAGNRLTEIKDQSEPFTAEYHADLDATIKALADTFNANANNMEE